MLDQPPLDVRHSHPLDGRPHPSGCWKNSDENNHSPLDARPLWILDPSLDVRPHPLDVGKSVTNFLIIFICTIIYKNFVSNIFATFYLGEVEHLMFFWSTCKSYWWYLYSLVVSLGNYIPVFSSISPGFSSIFFLFRNVESLVLIWTSGANNIKNTLVKIDLTTSLNF